MNATTTPEAAAVAATPARGAAKDYDAALAYLGGALMDALKADGFNVSTRHRMLVVAYLQTPMVLAEVTIKGNANETGYLVAVRWLAGVSRRPGLYDIDATTNRINTAGFLAAMHRETKRFADDLVAEQRRQEAEEEADRIRNANRPIADALTKLYGIAHTPDGMTEPKYTVPFLRDGEVDPADNAEGYIEFMLQPTMVRTTPELARVLFDAVLSIIEANKPQAPAA